MEWPLKHDLQTVMMAVEEKLRIRIWDSNGEQIRTMGQLYSMILAEVGQRPKHICVSSAIFYRLRRVLGELFGIPRNMIRTTSRLEDYIPLQDRRQHWQKFCTAMGDVVLPSPRRPGWLTQLLHIAFLISGAVPMSLGGMFYKLGGYSPALWGSLIASSIPIAILVVWAGNRLTTEWEICIPPSCTTVRDVVYSLVGLESTLLVSDEHRPSDAEIWSMLCGIVGDEFDVQPNSLTLNSQPWVP